METEILEQQAMNKIYNSGEPDELKKENIKMEESVADRFSLVPSILGRHGEDLVLERPFLSNDFSYLIVKDTPWQWHFLKFFNNTYGMVLPIDYIIEYGSTYKNSKENGVLHFRKEHEYILEYRKASIEEFFSQMKELEEVFLLLEDFKTEYNQIFREYKEDAIYMYQDGYVWKLSGYNRNDITEYFDMYLLLMSLRPLVEEIYNDNNHLKFLYLVSKNNIDYLYKGIDLKKKSLISLPESLQKTLDVVTISLDNKLYNEVVDLDYSIAKRKRGDKKVEELPITIVHKDKWFFDGNLSLGLFGNYLRGELFEFPSILSSTELSEPEKKELIKKVVIEKKQESLEKKNYLNNQFLTRFFRNRMESYRTLFDQERWIEFLKLENFPLEELSISKVKEFFLEKLNLIQTIPKEELWEREEWKEFCSYLDLSALKAKIIPLYLTITPSFMVVEYAIFGHKENFIFTEEYEILKWN